MPLSGMSAIDYPVRRQLLQDQTVAAGIKPGRNDSMKCLAITNIMGKSNPGDRVDMDVGLLSAMHCYMHDVVEHTCMLHLYAAAVRLVGKCSPDEFAWRIMPCTYATHSACAMLLGLCDYKS